ncbi:MAG: hypothetical protein KDA72_00095 [Planctomycetales bacterium]|nr:hypothetical protein [Planctomycetales bacterium]
MWGRVVEIMTAMWLMLSPFIFAVQNDAAIFWGDIGTATLICLLAGASYWPPLKYAHLGILLIAAALIVVGRFSSGMPATAPQQNHIFVGLFLLMIAIIPNEASRPPVQWRDTMQVN